jgi:hypothetical protein
MEKLVRIRTLAPLVLLVCVLATGCTAGSSGPATTPADAAPVTAASPTATPTPAPLEELVVSMEHLEYTHEESTETVDLVDGAAVLALFQEITGEEPVATEPDPNVWYAEGTMTYDWPEVRVFMASAADMTHASVSVSAPEVAGVPVRTPEGIAVGSTRNEALAAGARDGYDENSDGVSDYLELGRQEVPDTVSLVNGGIGILFVDLAMEGDVVSRISSSGNDFSDI